MRALSKAIDRFCTKHRRFGIPQLMRYIVFISAAVFVINMMDRTGTFLFILTFHPGRILRGEIWRLVTWVFLPLNNNLFFTAIMLYFYYFIGSSLDREWGTPKFTIYYIFGVLLNVIYGFLMWFIVNSSLAASVPDFAVISDLLWFRTLWLVPDFLNLSMFFAFAVLFPDHRVLLFFIIPIKMKWMAILNACYFAYSVLMNIFNGDYVRALLPIVALLNFIIICGDDVLKSLRPYASRKSAQTISFKKAARDAQREYDDKHYRHKCAVCGKTDAENPGLEFRYCSRCNGYHCFCADHINNHVHFQ